MSSTYGRRGASGDFRSQLEWYWRNYQTAILVVGVILLIVLFAISCSAISRANRLAEVKSELATFEQEIPQIRMRLNQAERLIAERRVDYPSKYSAQLDPDLARVRTNFVEAGLVDDTLEQLRQAIESDDLNLAESLVQQIGVQKQDANQVINYILGPPNTVGQGYYDELDRQSAAVDAGLIGDVYIKIGNVRNHLDQLPRKYLCSSGNQLSYADAYDTLAGAESKLAQAEYALDTEVNGLVDKPEVYRLAKLAESWAEDAKVAGNNLSSEPDFVQAEIGNAQDDIAVATAYVLVHNYQSLQSAAALVDAQGKLNQAKLACANQDFSGARMYALAASDAATYAIWLATPPTPTPPPTSTPRPTDPLPPTPVSSDDSSWDDWSDDSDDSSWDDWSDDSGSWDWSDDSDDSSWDDYDSGSDDSSWGDGDDWSDDSSWDDSDSDWSDDSSWDD